MNVFLFRSIDLYLTQCYHIFRATFIRHFSVTKRHIALQRHLFSTFENNLRTIYLVRQLNLLEKEEFIAT